LGGVLKKVVLSTLVGLDRFRTSRLSDLDITMTIRSQKDNNQ